MTEKEQDKMINDIASNISKLADSVRALLNGPLNHKALLVLLSHTSKLPKNTVGLVLDALEDLKKDYLK